MTRNLNLIRQIEVGLASIVAAIGLHVCRQSHWFRSGHMSHREHYEQMPNWWAIDILALTGLVVAAVIAWSGGSWGSRGTSAGVTLLFIVSIGGPAPSGALVLLTAVGVLHLAVAPIRWARLRSRPERVPEN